MSADDTFSYWATLGASKEKVKTSAMYSSALDWFKLFRKDKPISLGAVNTAIITRFAKWLDEQKARNGTDQPLSLDTRMVILLPHVPCLIRLIKTDILRWYPISRVSFMPGIVDT
ncbi:MAG: phage integrase SAM-like domain-containing protein [Candidatus Cryptobacteroides sp.]